MNGAELDTYVVLVKLNGKDLYLDPGSAFTPFGMLPWTETAVAGLILDKNGGAWFQTPLPGSEASEIQRASRSATKTTPPGKNTWKTKSRK